MAKFDIKSTIKFKFLKLLQYSQICQQNYVLNKLLNMLAYLLTQIDLIKFIWLKLKIKLCLIYCCYQFCLMTTIKVVLMVLKSCTKCLKRFLTADFSATNLTGNQNLCRMIYLVKLAERVLERCSIRNAQLNLA